MKNKILLLLSMLLISFAFVSAIPVTDESTFYITGATGLQTAYNGYIIIPNANASLISVGKSSNSDAPKAYIWSLGNRIAEANFVGDVATFSEPYPILTEGIKYSILTGNDNNNYNSVYQVGTSYPYVGININFAGGINGVFDENESYYYIAGFPSDAPHDIINITTEEYVAPIIVEQPPIQGIMKFWNFDKLENTPVTGDTIKGNTNFSFSNFFSNIWNWIRGIFN